MGFYRVLEPDELMHHGILGMRWGKKNGPPYPLGASDHSSSEKKAGWRKSLSVNSGGVAAKAKLAKMQADSVSKGRLLSDSQAANLKARRESLQNLEADAYKTARTESEELFKNNKEFKSELENMLYEDFGNGADDEEFFNMMADANARDLLFESASKYLPKTQQAFKDIGKQYNEYIDDCETIANKLIKEIGNDKANKLSDAINEKVAEEADVLSLMNLYFMDYSDFVYNDYDRIDTSSAYSFEEYNRKFGPKKKV